MKKRIFLLLAAFLLVAASLAALFLTNATAAITTSELVYFYRTWDDGYTDTKGFGVNHGTQTAKDKGDGDRYWSIVGSEEDSSKPGACINSYMQITLDTAKYDDTRFVYEFDFMIPKATQSLAGPIIVTKDKNQVYSYGSGKNSILYAVTDSGNIMLYTANTKILDVQKDRWYHIALVLDYNNHEICPIIDGQSLDYMYFAPTEGEVPYQGIFRFQIHPGSPVGTEICLDNLAIYAGLQPRNLHGDPGLVIDPAVRLTKQYVALKTGSVRGSIYGDVADIADGTVGAPFVSEEGTVYVPLSFLAGAFEKQITVISATSMTIGSGKSAVTVTAGSSEGLGAPAVVKNGLLFVSYEDAAKIFGMYTFYDSMGLVLYSAKEIKLTRDDNLSDMLAVMNTFVLDQDIESEIFDDITENLGALDVHPRIGATQDRFDELRAVYNSNPGDANYDEVLKGWITDFVASAEKNRAKYFNEEGGVYTLKAPLYQPYYVYRDTNNDGVLECVPGEKGKDMYGYDSNGDGYDVGGRSRLADFTSQLQDYGFAYQMTGDASYGECFYQVAVELDKWQHWGEGHFLNCADGAVLYATGFDWLYHAFDNDGDGGTARREFIASSLYRKAIFPGWGQFLGIYTAVGLVNGTNSGNWSNKTNNWVTVCPSGILTSILAIAEYDDLSRYWNGETYFSSEILPETIDLIFSDMPDCFHAYAPDGSYMESPGYWSYGTNALFLMAENLYTSTGKDYGLMNVYGLDKTCDFATNIESSDYMYWNYHDAGSASNMETHNFFFYGQWYGRNDLIALRYQQIMNGKTVKYPDVLFYCEEVHSPLSEKALDYYCEGIDTFVTRSSWEQGAIFTGLHGGPASVSHGNTDCGNFVIYKGTETWICDLGSDNYNVRENFNNPAYYRSSPEGANTVVLTSLKYGEDRNGSAKTVKTGSNAAGSYSVMDMSGVYGSAVGSAYRGLLYTADRTTIVIQDEFVFPNATEFYWFAHTKVPMAMINISEDGRTAYLRSGDQTLRATIISQDATLTFSLMDCYSPVLEGTMTLEEVAAYTDAKATTVGQREYDRSDYCKLSIHGNNKTTLSLAVVFEFVEFDFEPVKYEKVSMFSWEPSSYQGEGSASVIDGMNAMLENLKKATRPSSILEQISRLKSYLDNDKYSEYLTDDFKKEAETAIADAKVRFDNYKEQAIIEREDALPSDAYDGLALLFKTECSGSLQRTGFTGNVSIGNEIVTEQDGNQYLRLFATSASVEKSYLAAPGKMAKNLCIDFDYSSTAKYPKSSLTLHNSNGTEITNLKIDGTSIFLYDAKGRIAYVGSNVLTVGEWTHFTVVYHAETLKMDLYLNDVAVAEGILYGTQAPTASVGVRWVYNGGSNPGDLCLDNVILTSAPAPLDVNRHLLRLEQSIFSGTLSFKALSETISYAKDLLTYGESMISDESLFDLDSRLAALEVGLSAYDDFANLIDLASDPELAFADQLDYLNDLYKLRPEVSTLPSEAGEMLRQYSEMMAKANETLGYHGALFTFTPDAKGGLGKVTLYVAVEDNPTAVKKTKSGVSILNKENIEKIGDKEYYVITRDIDEIESGRSISFFVDFKVGKKSRTKLISLSLEEYVKAVFDGESYTSAEKSAVYDYLSLASDILGENGKDNSAFKALLKEYQAISGSTAAVGKVAALPKSKEEITV